MKPFTPKSPIKNNTACLAGIKVLIADDDRRIALIISQVLESLGFKEIQTARDGERALAMLKSERVDMLITDWQMTPMDGVSLVKYLRTSDDSPQPFCSHHHADGQC